VPALTYRAAVSRAIAEEMRRDPTVVVLGEDVATAGGVFKATEGLIDEFGPLRVKDTPISEQAIIGAAIGAAMTGIRPVAELMFADFAGVAFDQLANELAKFRYMTGGSVSVPVTVRMVNGAGLGFGAQHSQAAENWLLNIPGLRLAVPATPTDLVGLLKAAIRSPDPVLVFEHKALYSISEDVPDAEFVGSLDTAAVIREGEDVTIVATQLMRHRSIEAAGELAGRGIEAEVIDPRVLAPLDLATIVHSVHKTGRLLCVQECPAPGSWGATVIAGVVEAAFDDLDTAPRLLSAPLTPIPFSQPLEDAWLPSVDAIVAAAGTLTGSN
jgi:acetoin:2,6-dichlorophenolindophenol oxidoreductase subunit beta